MAKKPVSAPVPPSTG